MQVCIRAGKSDENFLIGIGLFFFYGNILPIFSLESDVKFSIYLYNKSRLLGGD